MTNAEALFEINRLKEHLNLVSGAARAHKSNAKEMFDAIKRSLEMTSRTEMENELTAAYKKYEFQYFIQDEGFDY